MHSTEKQKLLARGSNTQRRQADKSRYVYKIKRDWTGKITKRKFRLVALEYQQMQGVDYDETFIPVAKPTTFDSCLM